MEEKIRVTYFLSLILALVHALYTIYLQTSNGLNILWKTVREFNVEVKKNDLEVLIKTVKRIQKLPQHLAVILGPEDPSYDDLANIAIWCVASGIPFVSFYDHNGLLKASEQKLYDAVNSKSAFHYENDVNKANGYKNGLSKIKISVYSLVDGREGLVQLTRKFAASGVDSSDITVDFVDQKVREHYGHLPDPDLALYCGRMCSTYGFLPWHMRLTEFLSIKTHHDLQVNTFLSTLITYGKCEQRFGA